MSGEHGAGAADGAVEGAAVEEQVLGADSAVLDRITRLVRRHFDVGATSITVIGEDRAWFPSSQGLGVSSLPRAETLCDHTHRAGELLEVADARLDPRFADLEVVRSGQVVYYAGHPLRDTLGTTVGTLCLYDRSPRRLEAEQAVDLADFAVWAQSELLASSEMGQARHVQASLLPGESLRVDGWQVAGTCMPALAVGGDCFDFGVGGGVLHLGVGDVMGKGTSAALLGAGARAAVRATHSAVVAGADLGMVATQVARSLTPDLERAEAFITLFEAAIDLDDGYCRWVDAGAGLAAVVRSDGAVHELVGDDRPFGVFAEDHWTEHTTVVRPGDRLVAVSDGVLDLLDDPQDPWRELAPAVRAARHPEDLLDNVRELAQRRRPGDDVTVLATFREESA